MKSFSITRRDGASGTSEKYAKSCINRNEWLNETSLLILRQSAQVAPDRRQRARHRGKTSDESACESDHGVATPALCMSHEAAGCRKSI
jgi:hypothetical protein